MWKVLAVGALGVAAWIAATSPERALEAQRDLGAIVEIVPGVKTADKAADAEPTARLIAMVRFAAEVIGAIEPQREPAKPRPQQKARKVSPAADAAAAEPEGEPAWEAPSDSPQRAREVAALAATAESRIGTERTMLAPAAASPARRDIARALEIELQRIGCYKGETAGDWNEVSRRAMQQFLRAKRSNASGNEPEMRLLSLLEDSKEGACETTCEQGERQNASGQCFKPEQAAVPRPAPARKPAAVAEKAERPERVERAERPVRSAAQRQAGPAARVAAAPVRVYVARPLVRWSPPVHRTSRFSADRVFADLALRSK